ncbi:hypothetical protein GCM10010347_37930 [Streptomyces cirratus]|uniref:DUF2254 domain-containing protein n=1 Tax=Streptomyces cirratus TaxID=68187 RepID=A0ABQ3EZK6_9ACTN|nr:DUF2254 domain-containing protein [Streptomyces cirratus]GHB64321.1 hypothetical protein GCM10010347_37930 [Streptomyces cirratus]
MPDPNMLAARLAGRAVAYLRSRMWVIPVACLFAGVGLCLGTLAIDRASGYHLLDNGLVGTSSTADSILSSVAATMTTLIPLVLTITTVTVQLAMGQFSPRIVAALLHDRVSQWAMGLFTATFAFAIVAMRNTRASPDGVPGLTVLTAYVLVLASVVGLVLYVHHSSRSLRAAGLIDLVGDHTHREIDRLYPVEPQERPGPPRPKTVDAPPTSATGVRHIVANAGAPGILVRLDLVRLVRLAARADCVLETVPMMGDFVHAGSPLFRVRGEIGRLDQSALRHAVHLGDERTHEDDCAYGIRKLVDIAERSIAQPFNDPTTAVQSIDRVHDCLRQLACRSFPSGRHCDEDGAVRVITRSLTWDGYVRLALDEIRLAGCSTPQVTRRVCALIDDLKSLAPRGRQEPLDRQLRLLEAAVRRTYEDEEDIAAALTPDYQGIGSGSDVTH